MSKGMWTKQIAPNGNTFYFNASLNKSVWNRPTDATVVVHEAVNLKPLSMDHEASETQKNIEAVLEFANQTSANNAELTAILSSNLSEPGQIIGDEERNNYFATTEESPNLDVQSRIALAASNKQKLLNNKRFKNNDYSNSKAEDSTDSDSYLKLVGEARAAAGSKADDSSKWLVR